MWLAVAALGVEERIVQNFQLLEDAALNWQPKPVPRRRDPVDIPLQGGGLIRAERVSATSGGGAWIRARGIQYAEHPVGLRRWQPPSHLPRSTAPVVATEFGPDCPNAPLLSRLESVHGAQTSEGCLYLNVWGPSAAAAAPKAAVLVWFHGGSFTLGGCDPASPGPSGPRAHRRPLDQRDRVRGGWDV